MHLLSIRLLCLGAILLAPLSLVAAEPISPILTPTDIDNHKAEIGKQLFFDPRLSKSGFLSCNSCHNLSMGGADNLTSSVGHGWHQGPIANSGEMAQPHAVALEVIASIPGYAHSFTVAYGDESITLDRVTDAIAEFERTLMTPSSRFDQWLLGRSFSDSETGKIVAFLKTLTGDQPNFPLPHLPPSTPATPQPNPYGA